MARLADRFEIEPRNRATTGDDAVVRPARLRHQHIFVARSFRLDDVAGRRSSDLLIRREQDGDRQRRREGSARQLPDRFQRKVVAALHVEDARPEAFIAVAPPSELLNRADGVNGVEVAGDQDSGLALFRMRKSGANAAGKAATPRNAFDRGTHDRHFARGEIEHRFHRICIPGRAFAFHPASQPLQHGFGIKGKVGWIHCGRLSDAKGSRIREGGDRFVK